MLFRSEDFLRLPSLGIVPDFASLSRSRTSYLSYARGKPPDERSSKTLPTQRGELVTFDGSYSTLGEAYRNLRTALMLSRAGAPPKVTLITSAVSGEGKTVTAVNTAAMLAHLGANTLLIDADLRRSRCHRVLHIENQLGLTEVLTGSRELGDMIRETEIENLDLLSSGSVPPNPAELLNSQTMAKTLSSLREIYEYIVIDSSPVLPVSDALVLTKLVDGIVVVANGAATPRQQVRAACGRIVRARGKILGVVLNKIKIESPDYYYYYHHEYYGYGAGSPGDRKRA